MSGIRLIKDSDLYVWNRDFPRGNLEIKLKKGKFTVVNYYNNPDKSIPVNGPYHTHYLHPELPAYLVYFKGRQYVGTYKEIAQKVRG